jgi:hypothetical protein
MGRPSLQNCAISQKLGPKPAPLKIPEHFRKVLIPKARYRCWLNEKNIFSGAASLLEHEQANTRIECFDAAIS